MKAARNSVFIACGSSAGLLIVTSVIAFCFVQVFLGSEGVTSIQIFVLHVDSGALTPPPPIMYRGFIQKCPELSWLVISELTLGLPFLDC